MEKVEKTLEQLEAEYTKAEKTFKDASEKLDAAKKELAAKSEDEKLKKKVEGLSKAVQAAQDKLSAAAKAVEDAKKAAEKNPSVTPPKTPPQGGSGKDAKKIRIRCRSKTGKPSYFRAGLRFTPVDAEYEVTEAVAKILQNDPWLDGKTIE